MRPRNTAFLLGSMLLIAESTALFSQTNQFALRFHGTGANQEDRARFPIDDNVGNAASPPADIGSGAFTIEFWVKPAAGANSSTPRTPNTGGSYADYDWIRGNIILDRDLDSSVSRDFGISLRAGRIEFGTGRGFGPGAQANDHTLVSNTVLPGDTWSHVAVTRGADGSKAIYIGGVLDISAAAGTSTADISFPDDVPLTMPTHCSATSYGNYVVLGAEKHDYDQFEEAGCGVPAVFEYPSFSGWLDEVRLWSVERSQAQISADRNVVYTPPLPAGIAAYWRFEEGTGPLLADQVSGNDSGTLVPKAGGPGNWSSDIPFSSSRVGDWWLVE